MKTVYEKPKVLKEAVTNYCGGCGHGIVSRLIAELIDEMDLQEKGIMVWPVGCSVLSDRYFKMDTFVAMHGRAPATATGIKRAYPDKLVMVYQGDGDLVSEGMAEIIHAAVRGEKLSIVFINNAIFGMTGGQMAPTTLIGQKASTAPLGRSKENTGYPVQMAEMLAAMPGVSYSARHTITSPAKIRETKKAIKKIYEMQMTNEYGLCFLEILSPCPTGWSKSPGDALDWIDEEMTKVYPLGLFKDEGGK